MSQLKVKKFDQQIAEAYLPDNTTILMAYVRCLSLTSSEKKHFSHENLKQLLKGKQFLKKSYFNKNDTPFDNIIASMTVI